MSWHDPARLDESAEDRALRQELQDLLGFHPAQAAPEAPAPRTIELAEELRREAMRRRHAPANVKPFRKRPVLVLLAAGLPALLITAGMGAWGVHHKRRADALARQVQEQQQIQIRQDHSRGPALERDRQMELQRAAQPGEPTRGRAPRREGELLKPAEPPTRTLLPPSEQRRVKDDRR